MQGDKSEIDKLDLALHINRLENVVQDHHNRIVVLEKMIMEAKG